MALWGRHGDRGGRRVNALTLSIVRSRCIMGPWALWEGYAWSNIAVRSAVVRVRHRVRATGVSSAAMAASTCRRGSMNCGCWQKRIVCSMVSWWVWTEFRFWGHRVHLVGVVVGSRLSSPKPAWRARYRVRMSISSEVTHSDGDCHGGRIVVSPKMRKKVPLGCDAHHVW